MNVVTARVAGVMGAGVLALAGCADPGAGPGAAGPGVSDEQRYEVAATVLESPEHGPQLCPAVAESYPPQCGGPDIVGWDWQTVEAESADGTTWGEYVLVGTWDGERFTLTEPPVMHDGGQTSDRDRNRDPLASPCPEPDGGWRPIDPTTATDTAMEEALAWAATAPDYAGAWLDNSYLDEHGEPEPEEFANDPSRLVLNFRFTGDPVERERRIREVWGGALCVTGADRTQAELLAIQERVGALPEAFGSSVDDVRNAVVLEVFVASPELQQQLDDEYGEGAVLLEGLLRPVPG